MDSRVSSNVGIRSQGTVLDVFSPVKCEESLWGAFWLICSGHAQDWEVVNLKTFLYAGKEFTFGRSLLKYFAGSVGVKRPSGD
jgi:hypothetical protein